MSLGPLLIKKTALCEEKLYIATSSQKHRTQLLIQVVGWGYATNGKSTNKKFLSIDNRQFVHWSWVSKRSSNHPIWYDMFALQQYGKRGKNICYRNLPQTNAVENVFRYWLTTNPKGRIADRYLSCEVHISNPSCHLKYRRWVKDI